MEQIIATPSLGFSEAINKAASNIFKFEGRSRRSEFWWTILGAYVISIFIYPIGFIMGLATIPLTFRRLHDTGRSGWWWGIGFIAFILFICSLVYDIYIHPLTKSHMMHQMITK